MLIPWISTRNIIFVVLIGFALSLLLLEYHHGIGLTPDSAVFISAADSLIQGHGLTTNVCHVRSPLTHFPPLYPLFLSAGRIVMGSYYTAGACLNFLSLLCAIVGLYVFVNLQAGQRAASATALLLACSTAIYSVDYWLETDGVAIPFMVLSMCCLVYHGRTMRARSLAVCGFALAVAALIRYSYIAFIPAAAAVVLLDGRMSFYQRCRKALLMSGIALAPVVLVLTVNKFLAGNATDRSIATHLVTAPMLRAGAEYLSGWLLPYRIPLLLRATAICCIGALGMAIALRNRENYGLKITSSFMFGYVVLLLVSISLFDSATPLNERLLAPLVVIACAHVGLIVRWLWSRRHPATFTIAALLILIPSFVGLSRSVPQAISLYKSTEQGEPLSKMQDEFREILPVLQKLPAGAVVYSNVAREIYLVSKQPARDLPVIKGYTDSRIRTEQEISAQISDLGERLTASRGLVIYRTRSKTLSDLAFIDHRDLCRRIFLTETYRSHNFVIYESANLERQPRELAILRP